MFCYGYKRVRSRDDILRTDLYSIYDLEPSVSINLADISGMIPPFLVDSSLGILFICIIVTVIESPTSQPAVFSPLR